MNERKLASYIGLSDISLFSRLISRTRCRERQQRAFSPWLRRCTLPTPRGATHRSKPPTLTVSASEWMIRCVVMYCSTFHPAACAVKGAHVLLPPCLLRTQCFRRSGRVDAATLARTRKSPLDENEAEFDPYRTTSMEVDGGTALQQRGELS